MELDEIRKEIDHCDEELLRLFEKRMKLCGEVADYKRENNIPVFQPEREKQLLSTKCEKAPEALRSGTGVLFSALMDISKAAQARKNVGELRIEAAAFEPQKARYVAVYGEIFRAARLFPEAVITGTDSAEELISAVSSGEAEYGVLAKGVSVSTLHDIAKAGVFIAGRKDEIYVIAPHLCAEKDARTVSVAMNLRDNAQLSRIFTLVSASDCTITFSQTSGLEVYLELSGHVYDDSVAALLTLLKEETAYFRLLGCY